MWWIGAVGRVVRGICPTSKGVKTTTALGIRMFGLILVFVSCLAYCIESSRVACLQHAMVHVSNSINV